MDVVILVLLGILCVCMYIMKNEENTEEQTTQKLIEIESPKIKIGKAFHLIKFSIFQNLFMSTLSSRI